MDFVKKGYSLDGFHRGKVVNNNDPLKLGRVRVKVSPWFDEVKDGDCPWAEPAWNSGILYIPPVNAWVWVFFENSDPEKPVWFAWSLPFNGVRYQGGVWEEFGKGAMDAGNMFAEYGAEYPGSVVWRLPMGSALIFYANGDIKLINKSGSYIIIYRDGRIVLDAKGRRIDFNP
jgi:hypothetical protein